MQLNVAQRSNQKIHIQSLQSLLGVLRRLCSRDDSVALLHHLLHGVRLQHVFKALPVGCAVEGLKAFGQLEQGLLHSLPARRHVPGHQLRVLREGMLFVWENSQLPGPLLDGAALVTDRYSPAPSITLSGTSTSIQYIVQLYLFP